MKPKNRNAQPKGKTIKVEAVQTEAKEKWHIIAWDGNVMFNDKTFGSFDDANEFLTAFIEKTYPKTVDDDKEFSTERGEYEVVPYKGSLKIKNY